MKSHLRLLLAAMASAIVHAPTTRFVDRLPTNTSDPALNSANAKIKRSRQLRLEQLVSRPWLSEREKREIKKLTRQLHDTL